MKAIRTAALRCVYKVVIILLIITLSLTGCQNARFECGQFGYTYTPVPICLGVKSSTDTFMIDDVKVDLYFGMYDIKEDIEYQKSYYRTSYSNNFLFALYICNYENVWIVDDSGIISDYKNIDGHLLVNEVSDKEAFSKEYGYKMTHLLGTKYNHNETISIPSQFLTNDTGSFAFKLVAYVTPAKEMTMYYAIVTNYVRLDYEKISQTQIRLKFENFGSYYGG